jgi:hypothetical protein
MARCFPLRALCSLSFKPIRFTGISSPRVNIAEPDVIVAPGGKRPIRQSDVIDLPDPDSPTIPSDSPTTSEKERLFRTVELPNATERLLMLRMGFM